MSGMLVVGAGNSTIYSSTDGITYTPRTSPLSGTGSVEVMKWVLSLGKFFAHGYTASNTLVVSSPDGISWSTAGTITANYMSDFAFSPALGYFVGVNNVGVVFTSPASGVGTWAQASPALFSGKQMYSIAWSPTLNLFVAVGGAGATNMIATSPTGVTWTQRTCSATNVFKAIVWSPEKGMFVAVGNAGIIWTSTDGVTWSDRSLSSTDNYASVAWAKGAGKFLVGGQAGQFAWSTDSISWTVANLGAATFNGAGYNDSIGLFVLCGPNPMTSPTALAGTWTTRSTSQPTYSVAGGLDNVAPNAPTLTSPANSTTVDRAVTQRFGWTFSDPDSGDSQSKFDLQYRLGAGAWVSITGTTPNTFWDAAPGTFAAGAYEWQARTYDAIGFIGPWSTSGFFTAGDTPGVPSITAPTSGSTISTATATLTWSVPSQTNYQVRRVADAAGAADTATVYYDSGDVVDAATRSVTVAFPVNSRWEHLQVRVKTAGLWSSWADCRVQVSYTPPMAPTIVATTDSSTATIRVAVTNPAPTGGAPVTSYNDIYVSSPLDVEYRAASLVAPNSTWVWWTPAATRAYTIRAVAVGSNGTTASQVLDTVVVDGGAPTTIYTTIHDGGMP